MVDQNLTHVGFDFEEDSVKTLCGLTLAPKEIDPELDGCGTCMAKMLEVHDNVCRKLDITTSALDEINNVMTNKFKELMSVIIPEEF